MQDVRDPMQVRAKIRDAVLLHAEIRVLRPEGCPPDTVAGFLVTNPTRVTSGRGMTHWYGVKRPWRHLGLGLKLVEMAESLGCTACARFSTESQRTFLRDRGWYYSPRMELVVGFS